ncbi:MAG: aminotransferase class V-fold PLP-dependent enzyme [Gemmataceae bacterium]
MASNPDRTCPAWLGGEPLFPSGPPNWPPAWPHVETALQQAYRTGEWGQYHGPNRNRLEQELSACFGVSHALTCASGTLAVEAALRAVGVQAGDEVILAAYDYEANLLNVHAIGARPVLVDIHPQTGQLDPDQLDDALTPQCKAVICSHLHGGLVPMKRVREWADARGVSIIEDAAQSPGAMVEEKPAGSWGHVGTLSFGGSKLLTAGRGGAILTSDSRILQRAKLFLSRGIQEWAALSELQSIVLSPQLMQLKVLTEQRLGFANRLSEKIVQETPALSPFFVHNHQTQAASVPAFYKLGFTYDANTFGLTRERFCQALRAEGVAFDPGFSALHRGRSPSRFRAVGELRNASHLHESCVILHHPVMLEGAESADRVAEAILRTYRNADAISRSQRSCER